MDTLTSSIDTVLSEQVFERNGTRVLVLSPNEPLSAETCLAQVQARVAQAKPNYGGVLLRGFDALGAAGFDRLVNRFGQPLLTYEFGSTPRSKIEKGVYSSTEYPADQWIDQHNEQSYTLNWPATIWFYCDIAAEQGGATPVADSRRVYERLDPALRRHFADKQVMYVRNYGNGLDLPWEQVFGTDERDKVEQYCRANRIDYEWLDDGEALRTRQVCQSELRHPVTGETVWFNQAHLFHVSNLPPAIREALLEVVDEAYLPRNTFFGDGTPIDAAMLDEIRAVYRDTMLSFDWHAADTLILDNLLMSHGRAPFAGKRRVLVAMTA
ncbi:MAG: TauD/TfdA family dioxygenase [Paraburkholderia sp.]|jgi:alpha-ketoglutarate-dependent taurine dioxygenase|uniref:TauD/TfdA family dioxygenase n=1 Tax=Burkholderiaceae TaxID=119060 RepID=UPI0010F56AF7|nr:TauD/TfdA family dioxygenase [Burkholderia sp. 4M9327F10]